jgi:D-alanyl-D-alanine carboxypeptidase (penicillin-binding protein 5/6)
MRRRRPLAAIAATAVIGATALVGAAGAPAGAQELPTPKADIVVDAANGCVLMGANTHTALHPASTAKIMTALVGVERLAPNANVVTDARAAAVEANKIGLKANTSWPLDQTLAALMMVSANDAAYSIANTVGHGSLDAFAADLNSTAKRLGMRDSTFGDPAGLDDGTSYKGGPFTSAYDLAIAARNALTVPAIAKWAALHEYQFVDNGGTHHDLTNHNRMLPGALYAYPGAIGFKTGYTNQAQHSLVAAATRNGRTLIAVILGGPDAGYTTAAGLLDAGFAQPNCAKGAAKLPPVAVSLYGRRAEDRASFAALGNAPAATNASVGAATITVPASIPVGAIAPRAAAPIVATTAEGHHGSGLFSMRNFVIVLLLLGAVAFVLRRRAVKRQRARRIAQRRLRAAKMRSGGLTVVDGRYRAGARVGPPVESDMSIRRG